MPGEGKPTLNLRTPLCWKPLFPISLAFSYRSVSSRDLPVASFFLISQWEGLVLLCALDIAEGWTCLYLAARVTGTYKHFDFYHLKGVFRQSGREQFPRVACMCRCTRGGMRCMGYTLPHNKATDNLIRYWCNVQWANTAPHNCVLVVTLCVAC